MKHTITSPSGLRVVVTVEKAAVSIEIEEGADKDWRRLAWVGFVPTDPDEIARHTRTLMQATLSALADLYALSPFVAEDLLAAVDSVMDNEE